MKKRPKPLVVGNWKMNPGTLARAEKLWLDTQKGLSGRQAHSDVAVAPPLLFVGNLKELAGSQKIELVAQDVSEYDAGAHTGEMSVSMFRSIGIKCSIVGHSERRADGLSNADVNKKILATLNAKSTAILCVGERERDGQGNYFSFVEEQIKSALLDVPTAGLRFVVIAYEPVWAIGTGENAVPADVEEMKLFIQKVLSDLYDRNTAERVRVLYGGSVTPDNVEELLEVGGVDGFLVGGASLETKKFVEIIKITDKYAKFV